MTDLPPGARVLRMGDGSTPAPVPPPHPLSAAPRLRAIADPSAALLSVYPGATITSTRRDRRDPLSRANPNSFHPDGTALDLRPIPGMTFQQFIGGLEAQGYQAIEARDEVNFPSPHATGPHWHLGALVGGPEPLPQGARVVSQPGTASPVPMPPAPDLGALTAPPAGGDAGAAINALVGGGATQPPAFLAAPLLNALKAAPRLSGAAPAPAAAPPSPARPFDADAFKRQAAAIASDPARNVQQRYEDLAALGDSMGANIPQEDLYRIAEVGTGFLDLRQGPNGNSIAAVRATPAAPKRDGKPGAMKPRELGVVDDPRLRGINLKVEQMVRAGAGETEIYDYLRPYGMNPATDPRLAESVREVLQWRREHPGYRGRYRINLDDIKVLPNGQAPTVLPALGAPAPMTNEQVARANLPASGKLTQGGTLGNPRPSLGESIEQLAVHVDGNLARAKRIRNDLSMTPVLGGLITLDEGRKKIGEGDVAGGAAMAALGMLDFFPGGKGANTTLDATLLQSIIKDASSRNVAVNATEHLVRSVDAAVSIPGARVVIHTPEGSRRITGFGMVDETGQSWADADAIMSGRVRVEIDTSKATPRKEFPPENTRGAGTFYHGARGEAPELQEGFYNPANIYGGFDTFYTTDAADIAAGYGRKAEGARLYQVDERGPVNFFDMEQRLPAAELNRLFGVGADDIGHAPAAIENVLDANGTASLREAMDEMRVSSAAEGISRDEVQETFDAAIYNLRQQGFGGMTHVGGLKTGKQAHTVKIYFDAPNQIGLNDATPGGFRPGPKTPAGGSLPSPLARAAGVDAGALPTESDAALSRLLEASKPQLGAADEALPEGARVVRMGDGSPPPAAGLPARTVRPDEVVPIPGSAVDNADELPTSILPIEGPGAPGRVPKRPTSFDDFMRDKMRAESNRLGLPVRIDAEDAIDKGVPAELVYKNPNVADKTKLRVRNPSLFGTRYGSMTSKQQDLRSLDMDDLDPLDWGIERPGGRMDPEEVGDLLRRGLEGDETALKRGPAFDALQIHSQRTDEAAEFEARYGDDVPYERRGEPVSPEDLDALQPPVSAYEDAPKLVGKIGNLNLERIEKPEDVTRLVERIRDMVRVDNKALDRVTNEETRRLAQEVDASPAAILKWAQGAGLSPADLYARRVVVHQGRQKLVALAKRARGASDEELARFHNMVLAQAQLERQLAGMAAEAGRALQQFNMIAKGGDLKDQALRAYLKSAGDRETVEEMAEKLIDLVEDPAAAGRFIQNAGKVRKLDMLNELWINSLLSGPRTHIVNAVSNTFTALWTLPEQALAVMIGKLLPSADRAHLREIGIRAGGMIQGAREGLTLAKRAFVTGEPLDMVSKVEARNYHAIPNFGRAVTIPDRVPVLGGIETTTFPIGSLIRTPTRALTVADEFFKAVNRRAALNAAAYRRALNTAETAEARAEMFAELRRNPDAELMKYADDQARYLTFQKPLGPRGQKLQSLINETPGAKLIIPFVRTPINLLKFAGERSIFAPLMPSVREAFAKGGHDRAEALARVTLGSGLSAAAVVYAMDGKISGGGPTDPQEMAALKNSGWQPYSVKVGDKWISYQRFEPLSLLVGIAADFAEVGQLATDEEADGIAMALAKSVAKNVTSKTWLSGASDFFDALSDPERHGEAFASKLVSSFAVPAIVAHAAGSSDEDLRDARTLLDKIKQRVPGLSDDIEARRNVWGEPIKRGDSLGPDFLSPIYATKEPNSPLMKEVARLKAPLSMPQRTMTVDGKRVELTPEQYSYMVQLSGKPAKKYLEDVVQSPRWKRMDDDARRVFLRKKLTEFRATARRQLKEMFPELQSNRKSARVKARVKDGDTFAVDIRLLGTDAFEVKQQCRNPGNGLCEPCGQGARQFMGQLFEGVDGKSGRKGLRVSFTGDTTYGRPVATATIDGKDVGEELIRQGWGVPEPKYLQNDPARLRRYQAAEAEARQSKRGAHAFQFTTPEEYRRGRRLQCKFAGRP